MDDVAVNKPLLSIDSETGRIFSVSSLERESGRLLDYTALVTDRNGRSEGQTSSLHFSVILALKVRTADGGNLILLLLNRRSLIATDSRTRAQSSDQPRSG